MDMKAQETRLKKRVAEISGDLTDIEHQLDAPMPTDWEDRASERQGDEVLESLGQVEIAELERINAALARIADGSYGICAKCGKRISDARIDAVPEAALCINCVK